METKNGMERIAKRVLIMELKELRDRYIKNHPSILEEGGIYYEGLCIVTNLNPRFSRETADYVWDNVPKARKIYGGYAWSMRSKNGRIKWLDKHILKLQKELRDEKKVLH